MKITNCKWTLHDGNKWTPENWKFWRLIDDSIEKKELLECRVRRLCHVQYRCFGGQRFINGFFIKQKITALKHIVIKLNLTLYCLCCVGHEMVYCWQRKGGEKDPPSNGYFSQAAAIVALSPHPLVVHWKKFCCTEVQPFKKTRWSL